MPHVAGALVQPLLSIGALWDEGARHRAVQQLAAARDMYRQSGYALLPGLVPRVFMDAVAQNVEARVKAGHFVLGDAQTPQRMWRHDDPLAQVASGVDVV